MIKLERLIQELEEIAPVSVFYNIRANTKNKTSAYIRVECAGKIIFEEEGSFNKLTNIYRTYKRI